MRQWIILPYDGSPVAKAVLRRAARAVQERTTRQAYAGVVLATAGVDPTAMDTLMREAQAVAGAAVPLEVRLLDAGDPIGALQRLLETMPDAALAAPLDAQGDAPWYGDACRVTDPPVALMLFFIRPRELAEVERPDVDDRERVGGPLAALRRLGAWFRPAAPARPDGRLM